MFLTWEVNLGKITVVPAVLHNLYLEKFDFLSDLYFPHVVNKTSSLDIIDHNNQIL